ncbi:rhodanese-like domain-containing protein [Zunongwangia sp. H14]|uniref:rhodanese-like domain-containing protein n=1 Tax=Zunongwangia sp. H14 TaxID=3240792 RepID=UPI003567B554
MRFFTSLFGKPGAAVKKVNVLKKPDFMKRLKELNGVLIDVRTRKEFLEDHIQSARNINFNDTDFLKKFTRFNKSQALFIYCRSGARSQRAARKLAKNGFTEIYNLKGGFMSWQQ